MGHLLQYAGICPFIAVIFYSQRHQKPPYLLDVLARLIRMAESSHSFHNSSSAKVNSQYLNIFIILSQSSIITGHSLPSYHNEKKFFLIVTHEVSHMQTVLTVVLSTKAQWAASPGLLHLASTSCHFISTAMECHGAQKFQHLSKEAVSSCTQEAVLQQGEECWG